MRYDAVIFDLDGTLLNTLGDLRNAVNQSLRQQGFPERSTEEVRLFIGNGVANLMRRAVPEGSGEEESAEALRWFRVYYNAYLDEETSPYPGIPELLEHLQKAGLAVCVNSNKYDAAVKELCESHLAGLYRFAAGESRQTPKKPDPTAALRLAKACGCATDRVIYVGDSAVDVQTAKNAGMDCAWVSWGFRTREEMAGSLPEHCFDTAEELGDFLLGEN